MRVVRVARDLVPVNEFRANLANLFEQLEADGRPIVVTQRGRAAAVVLRPEDLDAYEEQRELIDKVLTVLREADAGDTVSDDDVWARVDGVITAAESRHASQVGEKRGAHDGGRDGVHRARPTTRRKKAR